MSVERVGSAEVHWKPRVDPQSGRVLTEVERLVGRLAEMGAERIVLFGSRASGTAGSHSDVDLLVVMPKPPPGPFPRRLAAMYEALQPRIALDLLVYTPRELEHLGAKRRFIREVMETGEVLYAS